jgi:hypothetical protein
VVSVDNTGFSKQWTWPSSDSFPFLFPRDQQEIVLQKKEDLDDRVLPIIALTTVRFLLPVLPPPSSLLHTKLGTVAEHEGQQPKKGTPEQPPPHTLLVVGLPVDQCTTCLVADEAEEDGGEGANETWRG